MLKTDWRRIFKGVAQIPWKTIKLKVLMLYKFIYAIPPLMYYMWNPFNRRRAVLKQFLVWIFISRRLWNPKIFFRKRQIVVYYKNQTGSIANVLDCFVAFAWLCEKMGTDIKIQHPCKMVWHHFKNDTIINTARQQKNNHEKQKEYYCNTGLALIGLFSNSSEYGYKILSKLSIKDELKYAANQWLKQHIEGDWVAIHYRGTDATGLQRDKINLDRYILYLQEVLDNRYKIFACSDQAQFIDKMREAFPGRVAARDIQRSYNDVPIHRQGHYQQEKDALIDILVLAKSKLIYTNGSAFVDIVRYFNPKVKIVTLNGQGRGRISGNVLPIPKKELFNKLRVKR